MKKIFLAFIALLLVCTFTFPSFAATEETYVYDMGTVTIIFDENDTWDAATREAIAHRLVYGDEDTSTTYNLLCTLFGHKYETKAVTAITHCVMDEAPRCLEEYFDLSLCSRCGDQVIERFGFCYIYCCP